MASCFARTVSSPQNDAMAHLSPCSHCHRHIRVEDPVCPFCGARMRIGRGRSVAPMHGLKRAAVFALSAAAASTSIACGSESDDDDSATEEGPEGVGGGTGAGGASGAVPSVQPVYGAPAMGGTSGEIEEDDSNSVGPSEGAGGASAPEEPIPDIQPLYGAPPSPND